MIDNNQKRYQQHNPSSHILSTLIASLLSVSLLFSGCAQTTTPPQGKAKELQQTQPQKQISSKVQADWENKIAKFDEVYYKKGDIVTAEKIALENLEYAQNFFGEYHLNTAGSLSTLANFYDAKRDYTQAEFYYLKALASYEKILGEEDVLVADHLTLVGIFYFRQEKYSQAEKLYLKSLVINEKKFGKDSLNLHSNLANLGSVYHWQGKYDQAEIIYLRLLPILKKHYTKLEMDLYLTTIAINYEAQGKDSQAEPLYLQALETYTGVFGLDDSSTQLVIKKLIALYERNKQFSKANAMKLKLNTTKNN